MKLLKIKNSYHISIFITFLSQGLVLLFNILLLRILVGRLSEEGFGALLFIRRFVNLGFPIFILNQHISLSKFVSANMAKRYVYLFRSFILSIFVFIIIIIPSYIFRSKIAMLLFSDCNLSNLVLPIILFLFATGIQFITFGFYRGKHEFLKMNIVSISFWIIQIVLVYFIDFNNFYLISIKNYFLCVSLISIILYISIAFWDYFKSKKTDRSVANNINFKFFLSYGVSRIPSGFIIALIYFLPIFIATKIISLTAAAYIGIIISITRIVQKFGEPFSLIFLPKFSLYKSQNHDLKINTKVQQIIEFIFTFPLLLGSFIYLFAPELISLWFGDRYLTIVAYLKFLAPFLGLSLGYVLLRGILDGLYDFPYLNIITFLSLVVLCIGFSVTYLLNLGMSGLVFSLGISMFILSLLSILILGRKLSLIYIKKNTIIAILWSVFIFILLIFINPLIQYNILMNILIKSVVVFIIVTASFIIYKNIKIAKFHEITLKKWIK